MKSWQKKLIKLVSPLLKKIEPDHGVEHSKMIFKHCLVFAKDYQEVDMEALFASSWLHDLGHLRLKNGRGDHSDFSVNLADSMLKKANAPAEKFSLIKQTVKMHDKRENLLKGKLPIEVLIFHDADQIDAVGSLGLARQFAYSGRVGKKIWDSKIKRNPSLIYGGNFSAMHTILDYQLNHKFYTKKSKKMAKDRKDYMRSFVKRFFQEWNFRK